MLKYELADQIHCHASTLLKNLFFFKGSATLPNQVSFTEALWTHCNCSFPLKRAQLLLCSPHTSLLQRATWHGEGRVRERRCCALAPRKPAMGKISVRHQRMMWSPVPPSGVGRSGTLFWEK